ncbi:hypothetical protein LARI1_G006422 [Lachnellula arida]|uniref:Uncharacterized protein n=1 Tax=Lachnellula arida TaxID=1316785 RepID=A0A8T9B9V8_9HELO|nr:hypothetical protein LARI1_G006422 [Lachnellula arida]
MQTLFDPVIADITSLLSEQVEEAKAKKNATIDRVILVGGFAESPYLYNALEEWCWQNGDIVLIRPANPQAAVVRGAALRGLEGLAPRIKHARRHYGTCTAEPFRNHIDPEDRSFISEMNNRNYCSGRMQWLVSKASNGLRVQGAFRTISRTREYFPGREQIYEDKLYSCSLMEAPEYDNHTRIEIVGVIKTRLPANFDFGARLYSEFNSRLGRHVPQFSYQTQVVFGSKGSNLTFKTIVNDIVVSTAEIVFDQS